MIHNQRTEKSPGIKFQKNCLIQKFVTQRIKRIALQNNQARVHSRFS